MKIKVKQEHIKQGERMNPNYCPVALAIREQVEDVDCVEVCDEMAPFIFFYKGDEPIQIEAPGKVLEFVKAFDYRHKVKPFTFELAI